MNTTLRAHVDMVFDVVMAGSPPAILVLDRRSGEMWGVITAGWETIDRCISAGYDFQAVALQVGRLARVRVEPWREYDCPVDFPAPLAEARNCPAAGEELRLTVAEGLAWAEAGAERVGWITAHTIATRRRVATTRLPPVRAIVLDPQRPSVRVEGM